jgi:cytochrome c-type biogenesis protein CcmH
MLRRTLGPWRAGVLAMYAAGLMIAGLMASPARAQPSNTPPPPAAATSATPAQAMPPSEAPPAVADPALEARVLKIAAELRCLVCQNQTIADSNAGLAVDLRNQVREMLRQGQSADQIRDYMTARYGDFVLYRPPVKSTTALLWYGPAALLVLALIALILIIRWRSRLPPERFEPDPDGPTTP